MKILVIDDQKLILLSVEKRLRNLGYEVRIANSIEKGIKLYDFFDPDLVLLDMNLPEMSGKNLVTCTGKEVIKYIRLFMNRKTPILVMSGNTDESLIVESFHLGIDDYVKKPVSLDEMTARIKRIIGSPVKLAEFEELSSCERMVQKNCVGVVVPCYNEAERLSKHLIKEFIYKNLGYHLCFVNDGSTDKTLEVLESLQKANPEHISILSYNQNRGKAEAIRHGLQYLTEDKQYDYFGFLNTELSTDLRNLRDFEDLVDTIEKSNYKIVSGSRVNRANMNKFNVSKNQMIDFSINVFIQTILGIPLKDPKCGAKIMNREIAETLFAKKFITKWLFDVELLMRIRKFYGKTAAKSMICEQPLKRWVHADNLKLSTKDSIKILGQLFQVVYGYRKWTV